MSVKMETDAGDITSAVKKIDDLVNQLCQEQEEQRCDQIIDQLLDISQSIIGLDTRLPQNQSAEIQLQNCAASLWNIAVARKTGGSLHQELDAKVRHLACNLTFSFASSRENFASLKNQITMAGRTARAWLDCEKPTMADQSLSLALQGLEKIRRLLETSPVGSSDEWMVDKQQRCLEVDREALRIYSTKAECSVMQDEHQDGLQWMQKAEALLPKLPKEAPFLAMLCYNIGCDALEKCNYEAIVSWLRESFELGKGKYPLEPEFQARTLRLLASAYLDWDAAQYSQKALNAVGLANAEHSHQSGLHLKIKILLCTNGSDSRLKGAMDDLMGHSDFSVNLAIHTVQMLAQYDKLALSLSSCKRLTGQFSSDPKVSKIYLQHLELLLSNKMIPEAKLLVEECVKVQPTVFSADVQALRHLHTILWEQAAEAYDSGDSANALEWYNQSLALLKGTEIETENLAKLQRNRASCLLNLQQIEQAREAVKEAETQDPMSPFTQYILFKVALWQTNEDEATKAIQRLSDSSKQRQDGDGIDTKETVLNLICLAAQMALEKSNRIVAVRALEKLVQHSGDQQQVLTSLRCLTRLQLTFTDGKDNMTEARAVLAYLTTAYNTLCTQADSAMNDSGVSNINEASWFMKIAWNMALETAQNCTLTHEFFIFCGKFTKLCGCDLSNLYRQKTCLLMASAAALQMAREHPDQQDKISAFKQCLDHVKACRTLSQELQQKQGSSGSSSSSRDTALAMLTLYEFEASANLGNTPELERILGEVLSNPATEIKMLESMAALALEPPFKAISVCKKALQAVIQRYLQTNGTDLNKCSKAIHSMVDLCLRSGVSYDKASREEAWSYSNTALSLLEDPEKGVTEYPEMEILWLLTRAWNTGVHLLGGGHFTDAGKWCGLAMKIMPYLTTLKSNYDEKLNSSYTDVLSKIENNKLKGNLEE
ncbi:testis-expressed protein 11-like [Asterias amurensis]|uniref:testis-expressed protein 11-like n=1 Tax=Asterias amurensis TaxID=7602 RepID=UPI003AB25432